MREDLLKLCRCLHSGLGLQVSLPSNVGSHQAPSAWLEAQHWFQTLNRLSRVSAAQSMGGTCCWDIDEIEKSVFRELLRHLFEGFHAFNITSHRRRHGRIADRRITAKRS